MKTPKRSDLAASYDFKSWRDLTPLHASMGTMLHNKTGELAVH